MDSHYINLVEKYPRYSECLYEMYHRARVGMQYKGPNSWEQKGENESKQNIFNESFKTAKCIWDEHPNECPECLFEGSTCALCV